MKIADFGLARSITQLEAGAADSASVMTDYVATRWYRAPEILLGSNKYSFPVDMWSLGCIFAEMLRGKPLFAGTSTLNQLEKICEVVGKPNDDEVTAMKSPFAVSMLESLQTPVRPPAAPARPPRAARPPPPPPPPPTAPARARLRRALLLSRWRRRRGTTRDGRSSSTTPTRTSSTCCRD